MLAAGTSWHEGAGCKRHLAELCSVASIHSYFCFVLTLLLMLVHCMSTSHLKELLRQPCLTELCHKRQEASTL